MPLSTSLKLVLALSLILVLPALPGQAAELSGVTMADSRAVAGESLVLNGMGLRKKAIFKVYVAGLYLPAKESSAEKILADDGARLLEMQFVRTVGKESLVGAWTECLASGSPNASTSVTRAFETLGSWMQDVGSGDTLVFTYTPAGGLQVDVKGKTAGTLDGKATADALFRCWLGPNPPSEAFKAGLLGQ